MPESKELRLEKKRERSRKYYYENRAHVLSRMRAHYPNVREQKSAYHKIWHAKHSTEISSKGKAKRRASVDNVITVRVASAQRAAKRKGLPFNITHTYIRQLYDAAPFCAISKLPFDFNEKHSTLSIDRIVPLLGYTEGNVRLVRWQVNIALNSWGDAVFYQMVDAIAAQRIEEQ